MEISNKLKDKYPKLYEAALEEFASSSYENASLNNILKKAGMSKGSFYHNIGDKYSLYLMLMGCIAYKKVELFKNNVAANNLPEEFFDKLKAICYSNVDLFFSEPLMYMLFNQYTKEPRDFLDKLYESFDHDDKKIWYQMVEDGIIRGDIRMDLSKGLVIAFIESAIKGLTELLKDNDGIDDAKRKISDYIDLIARAIKPPNQKGEII